MRRIGWQTINASTYTPLAQIRSPLTSRHGGAPPPSRGVSGVPKHKRVLIIVVVDFGLNSLLLSARSILDYVTRSWSNCANNYERGLGGGGWRPVTYATVHRYMQMQCLNLLSSAAIQLAIFTDEELSPRRRSYPRIIHLKFVMNQEHQGPIPG